MTKPYFYQPAPGSLDATDRLRLNTYRDQLYWQQQGLQLRQSTRQLTADQQQRLNQTTQESDRVKSLLSPGKGPALGQMPGQTTIGPPPLIPAR